MGKQIFAAEINLDHIPVHLCKKFASDDKLIRSYLQELHTQVDEVFILAACNRFTIYIVHDDIKPATNFFYRDAVLKEHVQLCYGSEESITHLFATASGLLSQVKGEHQIVDALKHNHQLSLECNTIGLTLHNLLCKAVQIGKKVRTHTGIDKYCISVVDVGFSLLYERLQDVYKKKFLVIGTSKITRVALEYLQAEGVADVTIVSHQFDSTQALAMQYGYEAIPMESLSHHFSHADIIISGANEEFTMSSKVLTDMCVGYLTQSKEQKTRIVLDFGMPRNFDSVLREQPLLELYNLDDLKLLHQTPLDAFGGLEAAWKLVMKEAGNFLTLIYQINTAPILAAYCTRYDEEISKDLKHLFLRASESNQLQTQVADNNGKRHMSNNCLGNIKVIINNSQADNPKDAVRHLFNLKFLKLNLSKN